MSKPLLFWLAVLFLFVGGALFWFAYQAQQDPANSVALKMGSSEIDPEFQPNADEPILTKYTLTERSGKEFSSKELDGKVSVTSFFFASCPSTCRQQNGKVKELEKQFGSRGVKFISITCDPKTDTPAALRDYARIFDADPEHWYFLTGDLTYIRRIGAEIYQVPVDKQKHSERLVITDRWGKIRSAKSWKDPEEFAQTKDLLDELLNEEQAPVEIEKTAEAIEEELRKKRAAEEAEEEAAEANEESSSEASAEKSDDQTPTKDLSAEIEEKELP